MAAAKTGALAGADKLVATTRGWQMGIDNNQHKATMAMVAAIATATACHSILSLTQTTINLKRQWQWRQQQWQQRALQSCC
jgi:hypothetical protein